MDMRYLCSIIVNYVRKSTLLDTNANFFVKIEKEGDNGENKTKF